MVKSKHLSGYSISADGYIMEPAYRFFQHPRNNNTFEQALLWTVIILYLEEF